MEEVEMEEVEMVEEENDTRDVMAAPESGAPSPRPHDEPHEGAWPRSTAAGGDPRGAVSPADNLPTPDNLRDIDAALYEELRGIAARYIRKEGVQSRKAGPGTTSLVNEVWIRLARSGRDVAHDRQHLLALASIVARRTLVDAAKARLATRRGGGARPQPLVSDATDGTTDPAELIAVDELLTRLAERYPRAARAQEMRVFGGFPVETIAEVLGISPTSVKRDLDFARRWIAQELGKDRQADAGFRGASPKPARHDADATVRGNAPDAPPPPPPSGSTRPDRPGAGA